MCCVVLAWESHCSWPTWPGNLAHPLSVPLSDFCSPGFWGKTCRCLCSLGIPWNAKFLGTLKAGSLKCQWKAELLNHYFPWEQTLLYEAFQEHPEAVPQIKCSALQKSPYCLLCGGQFAFFPLNVESQVGLLCTELHMAELLCTAGSPGTFGDSKLLIKQPGGQNSISHHKFTRIQGWM